MQASTHIYQDIAERTGGDIYLGIVGPVRTGKSTFIKRFMDLMVLPNIEDEFTRERTRDELPQSGSGKTIMTTEPKFVPEEAINLMFDNEVSCSVRLVDCVGYLADGVLGLNEGDVPRMVSTPWSDEQMPFEEAAELGTKKVITEHSTVGIVITTDGTVTELDRENYAQAEERVINELKALKKPFAVVMNTLTPDAEETKQHAAQLEEKFNVSVLPLNCQKMSTEDISQMLSAVLNEFPIEEMHFVVPSWMKALDKNHWLRQQVFADITAAAGKSSRLRDVKNVLNQLNDSSVLKHSIIDYVNAGNGHAKLILEFNDGLFCKIIGEETGMEINNDKELMEQIKRLMEVSREYERVEEALADVNEHGYGIVTPELDHLSLEEPEIIKQGSRFGVRLKASAPSIHMIKCNVETEIAPLVGTEKQSEELVNYLVSEFEDDPDRIWDSDIFGKSLNELVTEGLNNKVFKMPDDSQRKLRDTLEKLINDGNSGMVCIIV